MDLVEFVRARLDEDAELARPGETWTAFDESPSAETRRVDVDHSFERVVACTRSWGGLHHAPPQQGRVLRVIDAKRRLTNAHSRPHECIALTGSGERSVVDGQPWELWEPEHTSDHGPCVTLRLLALPYAAHPDYREEWAP